MSLDKKQKEFINKIVAAIEECLSHQRNTLKVLEKLNDGELAVRGRAIAIEKASIACHESRLAYICSGHSNQCEDHNDIVFMRNRLTREYEDLVERRIKLTDEYLGAKDVSDAAYKKYCSLISRSGLFDEVDCED